MREKTGIERCRIRKPLKKLDIFVIGVFVYWIVFVLLSFITYWVMGSVPDTLIQYGLGGGALELAITAAIEIITHKKGARKNDN